MNFEDFAMLVFSDTEKPKISGEGDIQMPQDERGVLMTDRRTRHSLNAENANCIKTIQKLRP